MAEDSEKVGGISVSIGGSDRALDAALDAAEAKIKAWVAKVQADATITVKTATPSGKGGASSAQQPVALDTSALEAKFDTLIKTMGAGGARAVQQTRREANEVTINGVRVGRLGNLGTSLQKAIGPVEVQADTAAATEQIENLSVTTSKPVKINLDTTEAMAEVGQLTAAINGLRESLATTGTSAKTARRRPAAGAAASAGADEGGEQGDGKAQGPRRKNIRDRGVGTEADARRIYTFEPESDIEQQTARARSLRVSRAAGDTRSREVDSNTTDLLRTVGGTLTRMEREGERDRSAARSNNQSASRSRLEQLSAEAQADAAGFAPQRTGPVGNNRPPVAARPAVDIAARDRQRAEEAARLRSEPRAAAYVLPSDRLAARGGGGGTAVGRRVSDDEIERQAASRLAVREATNVSAGRTARTGASSLGSFLFGGGRERGRAEAELAAATARRKRDERDVAEAERFANRPEVVANVRNRRDAVDDLTAAQEKLRKSLAGEVKARQDVESFSSLGSGARNLVAITAAGAAFGVGLQAISMAAKAAEKATTPYFDAATGYAQKTSDLTAALADQARQTQGNAEGVVALKLAQTGFSANTTQTLQPLIAQRAQIEAGNKALVEQIETFRMAENLRQQGSAAGIGGGGTGGILGTGLFGIPSTGQQTGNFLNRLSQDVSARRSAASDTPLLSNAEDPLGKFVSGLFGGTYRNPSLGINGQSRSDTDQTQLAAAEAAFGRGLSFVNDQLEMGGKGAVQFSTSLDPSKVEQTAAAFDQLSPEMATAIRNAHLYSAAIAESKDPINAATEALRALNLAGTQTGPAEQLAAQRIAQRNAANSVDAIRSRQQYEQASFLGSIRRQAGVQIGTQLPANAALANLANPPTPVGTGIKAANSDEARKIRDYTADTQQMQDTLNAYYAKGRSILEDTYKPAIFQTFGAAGVAAFDGIIKQITAVGQQIASIQAGISNEQAAYQTAQYNYQLYIAKRTLTDISGLTGKNFGVGKSELGVLEGQNLALSRQAQTLQFMLSQRQINLQKAVAGFVVPGLTPAEQNARVEEAKVEANYAQKQLNIQKQMFGNQVQIVDIQNLRQGADLVKQISLLQQGRQVTIDTQLAQEKLTRLNEIQQKLTAEAGVYLSAVNQQIAKAEANMAEIEAATGQRISDIQARGVTAAYAVGRAFFIGISGGFLGSGGGGVGNISNTSGSGTTYSGGSTVGANDTRHASGALFSTTGVTNLGDYGIAGEAGSETVAILRDPKRFALGGGGSTSTVNFFGDITVRTEADIEMIARKVTAAQGKTASLKGLRTPG